MVGSREWGKDVNLLWIKAACGQCLKWRPTWVTSLLRRKLECFLEEVALKIGENVKRKS